MKYKVGDKVKMKNNARDNGKYSNSTMTISSIQFWRTNLPNKFGVYYYFMLEDKGFYEWTDDMIEGLAEEEWKPKEGERVKTEGGERIYLCTLKSGIHLIVPKCREYKYLRTGNPFDVICLETIERMPEKKERKLMMTDSEWEELKSKNNINE